MTILTGAANRAPNADALAGTRADIATAAVAASESIDMRVMVGSFGVGRSAQPFVDGRTRPVRAGFPGSDTS
jgi:hypothetical protein